MIGTVSDSSGAVIPNAMVTLTNEDTHAQLETRTDEAGTFRVNSVPIGRYSVLASVPGFAELRSELQVSVGEINSLKLVFGATTAPPPPPPEKNYVDMKVFYATYRKASLWDRILRGSPQSLYRV